ncbi:MAG: TRAM domain-containing protein, partial [Candidatus Peregrinibacteria bacterium]|nr:TRAM domain-containing protein [Candidatus Peregrinibacteria bacterium]
MKKGEIVDFEITDLVFGGRGLAHVKHDPSASSEQETLNQKFVVFVDGALPGQKVKARITKKKKRFAEAKALEVLKKSKIEVENDYQSVPGAPWATLPIEVQGDYKKKQVFDLFVKFANLKLDKVFDEFVESPEIWNYRNKMEFSFGYSDEDFELNAEGKKIWRHFGFALGSKKRGQYWLVENLEKASGIFDEEFENFLSEIRKFCESTGFKPWNPKTNKGFFRQLGVRKSFLQNKFLINLMTSSSEQDNFVIDNFVKLLTDKFGDRIGGILWTITDSISDGGGMIGSRDLFFGKDVLVEKINGLEFEVSMDSFFQTNVFSAEKLYEKAAEYIFSGVAGDLNV